VKRFLILMALAAVAWAGPAGAAGKTVRTLAPQHFYKADGAGNTVDSSFVNLLFVAATNGSDPDTTQAFDIASFRMPGRYAANDSMVVLTAMLHWAAPAVSLPVTPVETTADTNWVTVQHSVDGVVFTTQKIVAIVGASNTPIDSYRITNQVAAMDQARFIRWIVVNHDKSTDAGVTGHSFWLTPQIVIDPQ
jgi:hypothetical protein